MFEFDLTGVTASIEVLPKGEYEVIIGTPKPFMKQSGADNHDSYGLRYMLTVTLPDQFEKKKIIYSTYWQSEGGQAMAKQFIMAALGYGKGREEENRFNSEHGGDDWNFDPSTGSIGDGHRSVEGQRVIVALDTKPGFNDPTELQQDFKGWRSITSGPIAL